MSLKQMKGTVITYCEVSKKNPNTTNNIIILRKQDEKNYKDNCAQFQWISYENPGLSLASISPGAMEGKRKGSESRESVVPWRTWHIYWEYLMLPLSRQEGRRDKLRNSLTYPWLKYISHLVFGNGKVRKLELALCRQWSLPIHSNNMLWECFRSWLRFRWAPKPSFYPQETFKNIFPKDDIY